MSSLLHRDHVVLITRASGSAGDFRTRLEERGIRTLELPAIELVEPASWKACDDAIHGLDQYDGVLFTSANAVSFFLRRLEAIDPKQMPILAARRLYAVGERTEQSLLAAGLRVTAIPKSFSSADLAALLTRNGVWEKRFLFPKSSIARDTLPVHVRSLGGSVDEVVVYENRLPPPADVEPVKEALLAGRIDVATFFSPSSVRNALELLGRESLSHTVIAVIGPTTAEAVREAGLSPKVIARRATAEALAEAVERLLARSPN